MSGVPMVFIWGLLAGLTIALVWTERRTRGVLFWSGTMVAAVFVVFFVLAGIDNIKSEVVDCREMVDPSTGDDVLSCRKDHWLPTRVWRVINRF